MGIEWHAKQRWAGWKDVDEGEVEGRSEGVGEELRTDPAIL